MRARVTGLSVVDVRVVEGPAVETLAPLWGEVTGRPFQPELMRLYRERADSTLDQFCAAAEAAGLDRIERCVEIGVTEDVILDRAAEADLLVMGRRGEHAGVGRRALGATLWRVLHRAPCAVLIGAEFGHADGASPPLTLPRLPLVAWNPGSGAAGALGCALAYCRAVGAELRVVHAGEESQDACLEQAHTVLAESAVPWESVRIAARPAEADGGMPIVCSWGRSGADVGATFCSGRIPSRSWSG
jgi:nucleotide-binding universal stress UspA family protein